MQPRDFFKSVTVSQAAYGLIRECPEIIESENSVEPSLLDKQGDYPVYKLFNGDPAKANYLCRKIKVLQASLSPSNMAIIARFQNQLGDTRSLWKKKA